MDATPFLQTLVDRKGSDLFITAGFPPSMKLDGELMTISDKKLSAQQSADLVHSMMTEQNTHDFEQTKECNFAFARQGLGRFRVSVFMQRESLGCVIRRIETTIPDMDELHLPPILKDLIMSKRGLLIMVGGTGTGKSTSLAAMIGYRNGHEAGHILTIEDPIEFVHNHQRSIVTQREVGIDTESFEAALKSSLRQAPDVILIGEIRSPETMEFALAFAETGHLCVATLHANNANQALDRIMHLVPEANHRQLLSDLSMNLKAIVAQQLIPCADGEGRRAAIEVLINTPRVASLIGKNELYKLKETMAASTEQGMQTFDQALFKLFQDHEITYVDALHCADSPNDLRLMIKLSNKEENSHFFDGITLDMD
ncbi:PilT/PilU family type 4a pilus ATPase [Shewanella marina]|uniref:PilT/PilU family type 4a pilus ATPase n=1 Tax=Shewanella marina TaxID=487319 RepID=UPI000470B8B3|nr:PilT/PilU family type 4a pilus ATPase [Shewanella marina]